MNPDLERLKTMPAPFTPRQLAFIADFSASAIAEFKSLAPAEKMKVFEDLRQCALGQLTPLVDDVDDFMRQFLEGEID